MSKAERIKALLRKRIEQVKSAEKKVVRIGVVEHQYYDDSTPVAYVAAVQEYGSPTNNIPPRPFFRPTIAEQAKNWANVGRKKLKRGASGEDMLNAIGEQASSDIQQKISEITDPPLSLATKIARNRKAHKSKDGKRKRRPKAISIKPLVDSGLLHASISHQVVDKE